MAGRYSEQIESYWNQIFSSLPNVSTTVDIGTGNGALALATAKYAKKHELGWHVVGVDAAEICPVSTEEFAPWSNDGSLEFIGGISAETLPFADESVHLITSQFALEYMNLETVVREIRRVLVFGGRLVAVIHDADASITKECAESLLFVQRPSLQHVMLLARRLAVGIVGVRDHRGLDEAKRDAALGTLRADLNRAVSELSGSVKTDLEKILLREFLGRIAEPLRNIGAVSADALERYFDELSIQYSHYERRLRDQTQAAMDEERVQNLCHLMRVANLEASHHSLAVDGKRFGWAVVAEKR